MWGRSARPWGHGVFSATQSCFSFIAVSRLFSTRLTWRSACHSLCRRTLQDWETHDDRHAALRNAAHYHTFCRGCRHGASLAAAAGDVRLDAAGDGTARAFANTLGARDDATSASVRIAALSGRSPIHLRTRAWEGRERHHAGFEVFADDSRHRAVRQRRGFGGLRHLYLGAASAVRRPQTRICRSSQKD
jgi:hypothetical protein